MLPPTGWQTGLGCIHVRLTSYILHFEHTMAVCMMVWVNVLSWLWTTGLIKELMLLPVFFVNMKEKVPWCKNTVEVSTQRNSVVSKRAVKLSHQDFCEVVLSRLYSYHTQLHPQHGHGCTNTSKDEQKHDYQYLLRSGRADQSQLTGLLGSPTPVYFGIYTFPYNADEPHCLLTMFLQTSSFCAQCCKM